MLCTLVANFRIFYRFYVVKQILERIRDVSNKLGSFTSLIRTKDNELVLIFSYQRMKFVQSLKNIVSELETQEK